jgi:hypothetical protein
MVKKFDRNAYMRDWMRKRYADDAQYRAKKIAANLARYHDGGKKAVLAQNLAIKREVLTHYGRKGALRCCWRGCTITDLDMLTLDHVNNDGAAHRKQIGQRTLYRWVRKNNFPDGFQTLCGGHQLKKQILLKRSSSFSS